MQSRFILENEDIVILNDKTVNGGKGSGNFGHAGRPGEVGGSAPSKGGVVSSAMRTRSFQRGDIVKISHDGKEYEGEITDWSKTRLAEITYKDWRGAESKMKVPTVTLKTKDGEEVLPFFNVKMIKNGDAPDTTPKERQTPKQKEALDEVSKLIKVSKYELDYLKRNCAEETAVALRDELKRAIDDGISLEKVGLTHNNQLKRTQARVVYNSHIKGSNSSDFLLELSGRLVADGEKYRQEQQESYEKGWHTSGTLAGMIRHELGHIKSAQIVVNRFDKFSPKTYLRDKEVDVKNDIYCQEILKAANPSYSVYSLSHGKGKEVSDYAVEDKKAAEVVAEAYSNPDYSAATKAIAEELDKRFKNRYNNNYTEKITNSIEESTEISLCTGYPLSKEDWEILHGKEDFLEEVV